MARNRNKFCNLFDIVEVTHYFVEDNEGAFRVVYYGKPFYYDASARDVAVQFDNMLLKAIKSIPKCIPDSKIINDITNEHDLDYYDY